MQASDQELGKAWKAFFAFNHKVKKRRLDLFEPQRWINVIRAIQSPVRSTVSQQARSKRTWTPQQRRRFGAAIAARKADTGGDVSRFFPKKNGSPNV